MARLCAPAPGPHTGLTPPEHRKWRRLHGLQLPLHPQQVAGWLALLLFAAAVFLVLVPALGDPLRPLLFSVLAGLFLLHTVSHLAALLLDPADGPLRRLKAATLVPEFDRSKHAHVIENGRCHLCNIETSGPRTKHCSVCNKCVARFDHHCKWLNHCIGGRNYVAFLVCVVSAVAASVTIVGISVTELVLYHVDRPWLNLPDSRPGASGGPPQNRDDTVFDPADLQVPLHDQVFLFIVSSVGVLAGVTAALLLHLCLFHVYISFLGVTTYEYIRNYRQLSTAATASTLPSASQSESESIKKLGIRSSTRISRDSFLKNSDSNFSIRETQSNNSSVEFRPKGASRPVKRKPDSSRCRWTCCSERQELNLESFREKDPSLRTQSFPRIPPLEKRCSVETVEAVSRRRYCCPSKRRGLRPSKKSAGSAKGSCKGCHRCKGSKTEIDIEPPAIKKTIGQRNRRPQRLSTFVVRRFLNRLVSRNPEISITSPVKRNQIRPSDSDKTLSVCLSADNSPSVETVPERSASLPALPPPARRHIQSVSLKELGEVLSYVQQPRRPSLRRHPLRRKSIPSLRPTMSPSLSPIHESGLSNPSTPQLTDRDRTSRTVPHARPHSWLAMDSYI